MADAGARRRAVIRRRTEPRLERDPVTVDRIVSAAFELVEADGLDRLSMRKLAERLGIQAPTLYWHVKDKHDLIDLLAEALFADFPFDQLPVTGDWRDGLSTFGHAFRRYLLSKRDAAQILANRFVLGPHMLNHLERLLGWLRNAGLADRESADALIMCLVYIHGFVLWETTPMSGPVARGEAPRDYLKEVREGLQALSRETFPHTVALADQLTRAGNDERFAFGLACLLDGITAQTRS
ncbi:TetR/AcrR family transcriptional regulator C-terminal domain-containing protein [Streptomyces sp. RPT161]|uniref:TetR/AcrR family transcriptional regulator C-terminal domain-containing protein n=1 Tax=Streptomyces sp. RPT161 TaxID=3015993 RepID=UPI0022B8F341|nr:TetR/AcrR family transcriptional regulator C-terminal domain-containing protein [Streptomyces sp. RPT161]